ncbi:MAG: gamma-glutamyl-gamma-aminobutyrate hydrolase family protein [Syntrophomonadaceae bacterium]|nr:gamma-glutamyl-gamma-aminobutyrate hydrolase family protein [Syntrophomonadaceae bacterium]
MTVRIGITCSYDQAGNYFYLRSAYVERLVRAGATPLILVPASHEPVIFDYVESCDGFLLAGGGDVDPVFWGKEPEPGLGEIDPARDQFELKLMQYILSQDIPTLGICRGAQVINVAAGGSLFQDLRGGVCHMQKAPRAHPFHDIVVKRGTKLYEIMGAEVVRVNTFHHQAVAEPGRNLAVSAVARDGVIEAIESTKHRYLLGIQWHPEYMTNLASDRLFASLVEAARR